MSDSTVAKSAPEMDAVAAAVNLLEVCDQYGEGVFNPFTVLSVAMYERGEEHSYHDVLMGSMDPAYDKLDKLASRERNRLSPSGSIVATDGGQDREEPVEEHGDEAVVDLEEPFISGVESHIHERQYDDDPELAIEDACTECGEAAHNFRCPSCGRPLCSKHTEVLGGYCSDYAGEEEGCQIGDDEGEAVTDGGRDERTVAIGPNELTIGPEDDVASLLERYYELDAEYAEGRNRYEFTGAKTPADVLVVRNTDLKTVDDPDAEYGTRVIKPTGDDVVPADLSTVEDGDRLHIYNLIEEDKPGYPDLVTDGGIIAPSEATEAIFDALDQRAGNDPAPVEAVLNEAADEVGREAAEEALDTLERRGEVYRPGEAYVRRTPVTDGGQHISVVCRNDGRQMGERPNGGYRCPECGHVAGIRVEDDR